MPETLTAGGAGLDGTLNLLNAANEPMLETGVATTNPNVKRTELRLGASGAPGTLRIKNGNGRPIITASGTSGSLSVGGGGGNGSLTISAADNDGSVQINTGKDGPEIFLGAANKPARIQLTTGGNPGPTIDLDGSKNALLFQRAGSNTDNVVEVNGNGIIRVGGFGANGQVSVRGSDGKPLAELLAFPNEGALGLGQSNRPGRISLFGGNGERVRVEAATATVRAGGAGANGTVSVRGKDGAPLVELLGRDAEAAIGVGQANRPGRISVFGPRGEAVRIDGTTGDIVLNNADCAEDYEVDPELIDAADPGTVMIFDAHGRLRPAAEPYDAHVAGVISGAGTFKPAMVLDRQPGLANRVPLALVGKVFCKVDATDEAIRPGDLLTTSAVLGHAMKVVDASKAFGAVIGKALRPFGGGRGLIPITVMHR
jgi:hypothetical protein